MEREERKSKAGLRPELRLGFSCRLCSGSPSLLAVTLRVPKMEGSLPSELPHSGPHTPLQVPSGGSRRGGWGRS